MRYVKRVRVGEYPRAVTMWPPWGPLREKPDWEHRSGVSGAVPKPACLPSRGDPVATLNHPQALSLPWKISELPAARTGACVWGTALPLGPDYPFGHYYYFGIGPPSVPQTPLEAEGRG